jgi:hypothetical protein
MEKFAVIVLIVVIIASTHVHNWVMRKIWEDRHEGNLFLSVIISFVYAAIMFFAFKYLILWAYPLIT